MGVSAVYRTKRAPMDEPALIEDYLLLSGYRFVTESNLKLYNVTCVINVAAELPPLNVESLDFPLDYVHVHMIDDEDQNLMCHLNRCVAKIHDVKKRGGKTLVHCLGGVSRSVSVCAAYLIKHRRMTHKEALKKIKTVRPLAAPNSSFCRQLEYFERCMAIAVPL